MFNFTKTVEPCMICRKPNATLFQPSTEGHVVCGHDEFKDAMDHPFVKPFSVWAKLISHISSPGQVILEPFAGQGSCVISALRLGRRVIACEVNQNHYLKLVESVRGYYTLLDESTRFA